MRNIFRDPAAEVAIGLFALGVGLSASGLTLAGKTFLGGVVVTLGVVAIVLGAVGVRFAVEGRKDEPVFADVTMVGCGQFEAFSWSVVRPEDGDRRVRVNCNAWLRGKVVAVRPVWVEDVFIEFWQRQRLLWKRRVIAHGRAQAPEGSNNYAMQVGYGVMANPEKPLIVSLTRPLLYVSFNEEPLSRPNAKRQLNATLVVRLRKPDGTHRFDLPGPPAPHSGK